MKTILITGGTKGVGRSLVELLLKTNHNVIFIYKKIVKLPIIQEISILFQLGDLAKASERKKIFLFLKKKIKNQPSN